MPVCPECGEPLADTDTRGGTPAPDPGGVRECPECHGAFVIDADGTARPYAWGAEAG
jgi:endogenous inhibitor of DNA gyrase (YacG/DUF329 family)